MSNNNYLSKEIVTTTQTLATTPDITSGTTSTYYLIGSSATTTDELDTSITSVSTIGISSINYTYPSLASATITISSSANVYKFNSVGGYLLLARYDGLSVLQQVLLIKYTGVSGNTLTGVSIVGTPPNYGSTITFSYVIYLKYNDYSFDAIEETLLEVGQNTITVDKDLLPLNAILLGIPTTGLGVNVSKVSDIVYHSDVNRYQRNTTPYNGSVTKLTRVDTPEYGLLKEYITEMDTTVPTITDYDFGSKGYLLVNSDYITFENGSGVKAITRGALQTTATTHLAGSLYYQYQLLTPSTTLRYNITTSQQNISITSNSGLTIYDHFLIAGATGTKNYEIVSSDNWSNSLDNITRNYLATGATSFPISNNINVYGLNTIQNPSYSILRSAIDATTRFIPLNDGSLYPSDFGVLGNYVLIDNELISLNNRSSVDGITRNYLSTSTATATTELSYVSNVATHSTLRQNINQYHLFLPLANASLYTNTNSTVLVGTEWFNYANKNAFDFTIPNRAKYNTILSDYEHNIETPVIIVQGITTHGCKLREDITQTTNAIPLDNPNTPYSTDSLVLIDSEFIKTGSKYTFDMNGLGDRQQFSNNLFTTDITGYQIYQVSVNAPSVLRDAIGMTTAFVPLVDGSGYSDNGIGLIDDEFFFWSNKNSLDGLTRTSPLNHEINTPLNIVSRLSNFDTDISGNIILDSLTIEGNKVFLSDDVDGMIISNTLDLSTIPNAGTVLIGNEQIKYNNKDTLANITRGTNGTSATVHPNLERVYLIDTVENTSLTTKTLASDIIFSSTDISLNNTTGLATSGLIIINSEIIEYTSIVGSTLKNCSRGKFSTNPTTHLTGSTVYIIPAIDIINNRIYQDFTMTTQHKIVSLLSNSDFTSTGTILIGSEIMTYSTKQALGNLERGVNSTIPLGYPDNTPLSLLNITLTVKDSTVIINTSLSDMTIELPDSIDVSGRIYSVKKNVSANDITINPYQSQTIDGTNTYNLSDVNAFISFQSDGANWKIISNSNFEPAGSLQTAVAQANAYTDASITGLQDGVVPGLDTLNKIAQSIANDTNFYTTMLNLLSAKLSVTTAATTYAPLINPEFPQNVYRTVNTVTQITSELTAVTINSAVGVINTYAVVFPANNTFSFTVNNNTIEVDDIVFTQVITSDTIQTPLVAVRNIANGSFIITMRNITGSSITPAISQKIAFQVVKKI